MESTVEMFGQKFKDSFSQTNDIELQLKLQAVQHTHKLRMMTLFTQFLGGRQSHQPDMPPLHSGHTTKSSSWSRLCPPCSFSPGSCLFFTKMMSTLFLPFTRIMPLLVPHHSHPPFFQEDHTHLFLIIPNLHPLTRPTSTLSQSFLPTPLLFFFHLPNSILFRINTQAV